MIKKINLHDLPEVTRLLEIQKASYQMEADLIGFDGIPPLHETLEILQGCPEIFYGYWVDGILAGAVSYEFDGATLDICRMMVRPDFFRRGIAKSLLEFMETIEPHTQKIIVSTGALNTPARQLYERHGFSLVGEKFITAGLVIAQYEKLLLSDENQNF